MSSIDQTLHGLGDLFCELYDALDVPTFRRDVETWADDSGLDSISATIANDLVAGRTTLERLRTRVRSQGDDARIRLAVLRGIDQALTTVNPLLSSGELTALAPLVVVLEMRGRLDTGVHGGALLPRLVERGDPTQVDEHPRDAFRSVVRVPEASWNAALYRRLPEHALLHRHEIARGIVVACCPFVADPDELEFSVAARSGRRFYRIRPKNLETTLARVDEVVAALDASGATLAILPELTLSSVLLSRWQAVLRARDHSGSRLLWVLAGTGDLGAGRRPTNTAVLLDARSGEVLARQDKIYPFNLGAEELARWKLGPLLGDDPIDEDLEPGDKITILDASGVRFAILICEDVARAADLAAVVRDFGVSHVMVPTFGRPLRDRRWERGAADVLAKAGGTTVVVANSLVLHSLLGGDPGVGLVVWSRMGDAVVRTVTNAADLASFTLLADGTARRS